MCNSALYLTVLAACLAAGSAKPADIVARVPSDFYYGTKWVLFRDNSIPDPPPNVIQHENDVQVLPSNQYQRYSLPQQQVFQHLVEPVHVAAAPVPIPAHIPAVSTPIQTASVVDDFGTGAIETKPVYPTPSPIIELPSIGVSSVPISAVHVEGPEYYLRKKKNA